MRVVIASLKFLAFSLLCLIFVPPQIIILLFTKGDASRVLPMIWMKCVCFVFGIRVKISGAPHKREQIIVMCNHLSYLDIPVIGSVIGYSFVAKADVAKWPLFGFLAGLRQTAYVVRGSSDPELASKGVEECLRRGESLIVFPEGTSTDGQSVIEFKTGIFARALDAGVADLKIQPACIKVMRVDGRMSVSQDDRDLYAWHRDMTTELPAHLWRFAKSHGAEMYVMFDTPIAVCDYDDRKMLAKDTHKAVSKGYENLVI